MRTKMLKFALKIIDPLQDRLNKIHLIRRTFQILYDKFAPDEWVQAEIIDGLKIYVNTKDRHIGRFVVQKGVYEKGTTKVFRRVVQEGMTVIDVGAERGYYSLIAASLVGENGRVFAFEPETTNYDLLLKHININNFSNIKPIKKVVSNEIGRIKLYLDEKNIGGHSIVAKCNECIEVDTITLDEFCEENKMLPDVVKMDIEGAEMLALKGMEKTIQRSDNLKMFIEFTVYEHNKEVLYNFLSKYFDIYRITRDGELIPFEGIECEKMNIERNIYCERA